MYIDRYISLYILHKTHVHMYNIFKMICTMCYIICHLARSTPLNCILHMNYILGIIDIHCMRVWHIIYVSKYRSEMLSFYGYMD